MNTISNVNSQPVFVTVQGTAPAQSVASAAVQETPSAAPSSPLPSPVAPQLPPPSSAKDYGGALDTMSAYTALIVLVCETNRESYAANRAMSKAQMQTRVAELKDVAAKRKTAAIVGLVMGVVSGAVGVAGGAAGIAGSAKNLKTLDALKLPKASDGQPVPNSELFMSAKIKTDDFVIPKTQDAQDKSVKNKKDHHHTAKTDKKDKAGKGGEPEVLDRDLTLRGVEVESARLQSLSVLYGAFQNSLSTLGQSASGIVSSEADLLAADAEATEGARQTTVSSMQQFQDLMGKFTQILSALLEAENKARSAAAQA